MNEERRQKLFTMLVLDQLEARVVNASEHLTVTVGEQPGFDHLEIQTL